MGKSFFGGDSWAPLGRILFGRRSPKVSPAAASNSLQAGSEPLIREADALRDTGQYAAAAKIYGQVLALAPELTDIRVQYANMLKDSGQFAQSEEQYKHALSEKNSADTHLQHGHLLKKMGRRLDALAEYKEAAAIDPLQTQALSELAAAGDRAAIEKNFTAQLVGGSVEKLVVLATEVVQLRQKLEAIAKLLPDPLAAAAFPETCYKAFRQLFDVPQPNPLPAAGTTILVLLAADETPVEILYKQIEALANQSYPNWSAIFFGSKSSHGQVVERVAAADGRISWKDTPPEKRVADCEIDLSQDSKCACVLLTEPGAVLHSHALNWIAAAFEFHKANAYVFDSEILTSRGAESYDLSPQLLETLSYDTLLERNVYGNNVAMERSFFLNIASRLATSSIATARHGVLLEAMTSGAVGHIPLPLASVSVRHAPDLAAAHETVCRHIKVHALANQISMDEPQSDRLIIRWRAEDCEIDVIIPSRDNSKDVSEFVQSLIAFAKSPSKCLISIIDNCGNEETKRALKSLEGPKVRLLPFDEPFNWSRFNNYAVSKTRAPIIVFANDDMRMLTPAWDEIVRGQLSRPETGALGARLLYPDGSIQHAGILMRADGTNIHDGLFEEADEAGPNHRWKVTRNVAAVTGAFMATRRTTFEDLQGFDERHLPVGLSDVDYAFKARSKGYRIVWTPDISLCHFESKSRGYDHLEDYKRVRDEAERSTMFKRWGPALSTDPGVNPYWYNSPVPFRFIAQPSAKRLADYMRFSSQPNPWAIERLP